ncbi:ribosomal-processing cysteine protease Prp [Paenibacillus glycanilyticus]|uniref:ribosomal-processing cysteine protease Prp n=1 Tax=Paenibacillus glycanilyticus TaxID=126569 RepID=UPI003EB9CD43
MVRINIHRKKSGEICGIEVSGHSGYASAGNDIVCAGVSSLVFTALNSLIELGQYTDEELAVDIQKGYTSFHIPEKSIEEQTYIASIIRETTRIGFEQISESYPKNVFSEMVNLKKHEHNMANVVQEEQDYVSRVNYARRIDF